jgi:hypothetical protein
VATPIFEVYLAMVPLPVGGVKAITAVLIVTEDKEREVGGPGRVVILIGEEAMDVPEALTVDNVTE